MKKIYCIPLLFCMFLYAQKKISKAEISDAIIAQIKIEKMAVLKQLNLVKGQKTNNLYELFAAKSDSLLSELNKNEYYILDGMNIGYDLESFNLPDSLSTKLDFFRTAAILVRGTGEGYSELYYRPDYYYNLFKNKVTPDLVAYLKIKPVDSDNYTGDGATAISWQQLGERIVTRENFLKKFSKSKFVTPVKENLKTYLYNYFFGSDNTLTIENNNFKETTMKYFKDFIKQNPKLKTTKIIKNMIIYMDKNKSRELLEAYLKNEILIFR